MTQKSWHKNEPLYVSDWCKAMEYTLENNFDPRYYDVIGVDLEALDKDFMEFIDYRHNGEAYELICYGNVLYTENFYMQQFLQDEYGLSPMWIDCSMKNMLAENLQRAGYVW